MQVTKRRSGSRAALGRGLVDLAHVCRSDHAASDARRDSVCAHKINSPLGYNCLSARHGQVGRSSKARSSATSPLSEREALMSCVRLAMGSLCKETSSASWWCCFAASRGRWCVPRPALTRRCCWPMPPSRPAAPASRRRSLLSGGSTARGCSMALVRHVVHSAVSPAFWRLGGCEAVPVEDFLWGCLS